MSYSTPWHCLPLEGRALPEYLLAHLWHRHRVQLAAGDGHPVIVIPGFGADARATAPLREALRAAGHDLRDWGQGRNTGMSRKIGQGLGQTVQEAAERSAGPVSLIGWSLGGVFARELARRMPETIRQVITLGSPIQDGDHTTIGMLFRLQNRGTPSITPEALRQERAAPPPVPCTAIYTISDGIVPWQASLEQEGPQTRNIRVRGSHMGMPANPQVWKACAEILAQP